MRSLSIDGLLSFIRKALKEDSVCVFPDDWSVLIKEARRQGVSPVVFDGYSCCFDRGEVKPAEDMPDAMKKKWIASVYKDERISQSQLRSSAEMAELFAANGIRTYVLKGQVIAECYPVPSHRRSVDMDCFLTSADGKETDASERGNQVIEGKGIKVGRTFYKNSSFFFKDVHVENHRFLTPFRGNKLMTRFEGYLQNLLREDEGSDRIDGTWLCRPPVMVSALFLIEHSYSHFLHEGLTIRHILDWVMFRRRHEVDIDWGIFEKRINEYGFRRFYDAYAHVGEFIVGERSGADLTTAERRMMDSVWEGLDLHETVEGVRGKLNLAGNTFRASWKYRLFSPISMLHALWIQVKGFLFIRKPKVE